MKIKFNPKKNEWEVLEKYSKEGYYVDGKIWKIIQNIFYILSKDWDVVFLIDGVEGSGKSVLGLFLGYIISKTKFTINNIAESSDDAIKRLEGLPDGSVLMIDEGELMFSSKEVMRKEQRQLIKILNVIRQKKMVLIIISPIFFDLNKYISVSRSRFLLHVYTDKKLTRGRVAYFGEKRKKILYGLGKKNYSSYGKPKANFVASFRVFEPDWYKEYLKTKLKSLREVFKDKENSPESKYTLFQEYWRGILGRMDICKPPLLQKQKSQLIEISRQSIYDYGVELGVIKPKSLRIWSKK